MKRSSRRGFRRDRRAVAAVDFAIVATPLLMLVLGTIEFGRLIWMREALQMTAIQAARCMGVRQPACSAGGEYNQTNTQSYVIGLGNTWGIPLTNANLTLPTGGVASSGVCNGLAEISISYTFQTAVPGLLTMLSGGKALTGHACFPRQS
jgi:Flp pilus assembly protein TadG